MTTVRWSRSSSLISSGSAFAGVLSGFSSGISSFSVPRIRPARADGCGLLKSASIGFALMTFVFRSHVARQK